MTVSGRDGTGRRYFSPTQRAVSRAHGGPPGLNVISVGLPVGILELDAVGSRHSGSGTKTRCRYGLPRVLVSSRGTRCRRLSFVFHKRRGQPHEPWGTSPRLTGAKGGFTDEPYPRNTYDPPSWSASCTVTWKDPRCPTRDDVDHRNGSTRTNLGHGAPPGRDGGQACHNL